MLLNSDLHCGKRQLAFFAFGPPKPEIPLKANMVPGRLASEVVVQSMPAQISTNDVKHIHIHK